VTCCSDVLRTLSAAAGMLAISATAMAHSASDAYLTLTLQNRAGPETEANTVLHAEWDIALRDLDFVLGLDDNGDGRIIWRELREHQAEIASYAYRYIAAAGDGRACAINPLRQMVDFHADGAYAALFFDINCGGAPKKLALDYHLFFGIDPSHRGILIMHSKQNIATSVLSPDNTKIDIAL